MDQVLRSPQQEKREVEWCPQVSHNTPPGLLAATPPRRWARAHRGSRPCRREGHPGLGSGAVRAVMSGLRGHLRWWAFKEGRGKGISEEGTA